MDAKELKEIFSRSIRLFSDVATDKKVDHYAQEFTDLAEEYHQEKMDEVQTVWDQGENYKYMTDDTKLFISSKTDDKDEPSVSGEITIKEVTDEEIEIGIRETLDDGYQVFFTIGHQTFHLSEHLEDTPELAKETAEFMERNLRIAFGKVK